MKEFAKHPEVHVAGLRRRMSFIVFGGQTLFMGTYANVWTDSYGPTYGAARLRYGVNGQGSVVKLIPPNRIRVISQFSATRTNMFQRRPSTNLVRDFMTAWEKANR